MKSESTFSEVCFDPDVIESNDTRILNPLRTAGDPADVYR